MIRLDGAKGLVKSKFFPYKRAIPSHKNSVLIGIGGNIGDVKTRFCRLFWLLKRDSRFKIAESSPILLNTAFGYESEDYLNATMELKTSLNASEILKIMQAIELRFGRKRPFKNAPRTLDIDLLYFSRKVHSTARLTLPHAGAKDRISVILPLAMMKGVRWLRY